LTRRGYWYCIGGIMLGLIILCIVLGYYSVNTPEENMATEVRNNDPLTVILYSPLGNATVLLVLQFLLANVLLWPTVWLINKFKSAEPSRDA
jgi:hypothetical protein